MSHSCFHQPGQVYHTMRWIAYLTLAWDEARRGVRWKKSGNAQLVAMRCNLTGLSQDIESAAAYLDLFFLHFLLHTVVRSGCLTGGQPGKGGEDPRSRRCDFHQSLQWFDEGDTRPACINCRGALARLKHLSVSMATWSHLATLLNAAVAIHLPQGLTVNDIVTQWKRRHHSGTRTSVCVCVRVGVCAHRCAFLLPADMYYLNILKSFKLPCSRDLKVLGLTHWLIEGQCM